MKRCIYLLICILSFHYFLPIAKAADPDEVAKLVAVINSVGPKGEGHQQAAAAWRELSKSSAEHLPAILAGMDTANTLSTNWLRAVVDTIAQNTLDKEDFPATEIEKFVLDSAHSAHGRRLAYEILLEFDKSAKDRLVPKFLNDPSLELRRDAVARLSAEADEARDKGDEDKAQEVYRVALTNARDIDQIDHAAEQLRKLKANVDLPSHFGFVQGWHLIGPFDNVAKRGFDVAYPPETTVDLNAQHEGVGQKSVSWKQHATEDDYGMVDLNKAMANHKGAIAYAAAEFNASAAQEVDLRLGCINANKVWLNGELIFANDVYHANTYIDQYVGTGRLQKGKNLILIKVAQNEQEENWAQRWQFQLRVCDEFGTAVLPQK
ncbi:MAG: hypothetical protein ACI9G1_000808 [Pirellulaceae bacterium]|jgi:hypothetical protein